MHFCSFLTSDRANFRLFSRRQRGAATSHVAGGAEVARERATSVTVTWDPHTERTTAAPSPALSGPCDSSATPTELGTARVELDPAAAVAEFNVRGDQL